MEWIVLYALAYVVTLIAATVNEAPQEAVGYGVVATIALFWPFAVVFWAILRLVSFGVEGVMGIVEHHKNKNANKGHGGL